MSGITNNKAFFAKKKLERERLLVEKGTKNNYAIVEIETPDKPILNISATKPANSYTSITHPATQLEGDKQRNVDLLTCGNTLLAEGQGVRAGEFLLDNTIWILNLHQSEKMDSIIESKIES